MMIELMLSKAILLVGCLCFLFFNGTGQAKTNLLKNMQVFESSTKTWQEMEVLLSHQKLYLPTKILQDRFGLVRKDLSDDKVGICLNELCIPFSKGKDANSIQVYEDQEYVPIQHLIQALNGTFVWEANSDEILMALQKSQYHTSEFSASAHDFTLIDTGGHSVSLSDFRGKKVVVFAWASW